MDVDLNPGPIEQSQSPEAGVAGPAKDVAARAAGEGAGPLAVCNQVTMNHQQHIVDQPMREAGSRSPVRPAKKRAEPRPPVEPMRASRRRCGAEPAPDVGPQNVSAWLCQAIEQYGDERCVRIMSRALPIPENERQAKNAHTYEAMVKVCHAYGLPAAGLQVDAILEQSGTGIDHDTCWLFVRLPDVMTDIFYWDSTSTVAGKLKKALEKHGWVCQPRQASLGPPAPPPTTTGRIATEADHEEQVQDPEPEDTQAEAEALYTGPEHPSLNVAPSIVAHEPQHTDDREQAGAYEPQHTQEEAVPSPVAVVIKVSDTAVKQAYKPAAGPELLAEGGLRDRGMSLEPPGSPAVGEAGVLQGAVPHADLAGGHEDMAVQPVAAAGDVNHDAAPITDLQAALAKPMAQIQDILARTVTSACNDLNRQIDRLNRQNADLKQQVTDLNQQISDLGELCDALNAENAVLKADNSKNLLLCKQQQEYALRDAGEQEALRGEISMLKQRLDAAQAATRAARDASGAAEAECARLREQKARLLEANAQLTTANERLKKENEQLSETNGQLTEKNAYLKGKQREAMAALALTLTQPSPGQ